MKTDQRSSIKIPIGDPTQKKTIITNNPSYDQQSFSLIKIIDFPTQQDYTILVVRNNEEAYRLDFLTSLEYNVLLL